MKVRSFLIDRPQGLLTEQSEGFTDTKILLGYAIVFSHGFVSLLLSTFPIDIDIDGKYEEVGGYELWFMPFYLYRFSRISLTSWSFIFYLYSGSLFDR